MKPERFEALSRPGTRAIEAIVRILCDKLPPKAADGAYLFAQTRDNERSVFDAAKKMIDELLAQCLWILDAPPGSGYAGGDEWEGSLKRLGLSGSVYQ